MSLNADSEETHVWDSGKRKPRIAFLLEFPTLLGGERSWLAIARIIPGIEPVAVARPAGPLADKVRNLGIELVPFDWPSADPEVRAGMLAPALRKAGITAVHANSLTTCMTAAALHANARIPASGHVRDIMRLSAARVSRLNALRAIVAVSEAAARSLKSQGVDQEKVTVVRNGIDASEEFAPNRVADSLRLELGVDPKTPVIGFVGQMVRRKDPLSFVRAFAMVKARFPSAVATVVGARHSVKAEAVEYENQVLSEAGPGVRFLGERSDPAGLIRGMDVVAVTSRQEPLSRVILESMALGRAIAASDVGGNPELILEGRNGLLFPAGDIAFAAERICELVADPDLRLRLGDAARARVLSEFTPKACALGLLNAIARAWLPA